VPLPSGLMSQRQALTSDHGKTRRNSTAANRDRKHTAIGDLLPEVASALCMHTKIVRAHDTDSKYEMIKLSVYLIKHPAIKA
jgi:hypothetical protein